MMIIPDINLLVYAYNADSLNHIRAKSWWERQLNGTDIIGLPWIVLHGFVRIMTHPRIMEYPILPGEAMNHVLSWIGMNSSSIIEPGRLHMLILRKLLEGLGSAGNMTTDAVIASIAIEYQAEVHTNDADFSRFSGLRWVNPLK